MLRTRWQLPQMVSAAAQDAARSSQQHVLAVTAAKAMLLVGDLQRQNLQGEAAICFS